MHQDALADLISLQLCFSPILFNFFPKAEQLVSKANYDIVQLCDLVPDIYKYRKNSRKRSEKQKVIDCQRAVKFFTWAPVRANSVY